jgi:hypothetical protein
MRTWALVKDGIIFNVVKWDGSDVWSPPSDAIAIDITDLENGPGPGWAYDGNVFIEPVPPKPPVPRSITRRQCALQLLNRLLITGPEALDMTRNGTPPAAIMTYIETLSADDQIKAQIDFAAENYFRTNELLIAIMTANNLSSDDIDDFFIEANKL